MISRVVLEVLADKKMSKFGSLSSEQNGDLSPKEGHPA
jgi:hypothetical protein